jgi:hypothetical protein
MLTEVQDRNSILRRALEIASAEEREAYLAQACGNDAALRRQIEEEVAAHFHAAHSDKPEVAAAAGALSHGQGVEPNGTNPREVRVPAGTRTSDKQQELTHESLETKKMEHKNPRGLVTVGTLLGLVAIAGASTSLTVWALKAEGPAQTAAQQAQEERDKARKAEAEAKQQAEEAQAAAQAAAKERDEARASQKEIENSEKVNKAVLAFLQSNVLTRDAKQFWSSDDPNKDVKLLEAVDAAEAKVAKLFGGQPLVEASTREILGLSYLGLDQPKKAVAQLKRALYLRQEELGQDAKATGECRNNLARAYRLANLPDDASRLFDQNDQNNPEQKNPKGKKPARGQAPNPQGV